MAHTDKPTLRIHGPVDLLTGIPYLLGFHPNESLVLVGLTHGALAVTARLDLADATDERITTTVAAMTRGGSTQFIAAVYTAVDAADLPFTDLLAMVTSGIAQTRAGLLDFLLVREQLWW